MALPVAAVVGTGFIGPVHVEALRRLGVRVKGMLGSTPDKSRAAAAQLGLERGYEDYAAVLADREVTVVHLTSPNRHHRAQVLAALGTGKHVICEKPLALTAAETAELVAAAKAHPQLVCAVNYNVRFYPLALHARALVRRGEIGEVLHLHGSYLQDWLLKPTDFNWRVLAAEGGDLRAVGDVGTHWLDLIGFVTGLEIESVMADLHTVHPVRERPAGGSVGTFTGSPGPESGAPHPVAVTTDDYGAVLLRFRGGARGVCHFSQVAAGRKNCLRFELSGTRRSLAWNSESPEELWIGERGEPSRLLQRDPGILDASAARFSAYPGGHAEGYPDTFKQLYRAIYADIAGGGPSAEPLYATFADGHRELVLCAAIAESHRTGRWVNVPG
ncbi:MAG: Gfo/Idh/MocA family oxidoreductase [Opitutaceae bacterium]|nr:Gfo/Idh/MocA family oxidoreductase [Opitutaceae bacterium]